MTELLNYLLTRRSVKAQALTDPAPSLLEIEQMIRVAARVPDHGKLAPWRFHLFDKAVQSDLAQRVAERFAALHADATEKQIAFEREKIMRAPLLIVVVSKPQLGRISLWEQQLCAGAACMNLLHAAYALGYKGQWLSEWVSYDAEVRQWFGCEHEHEQIAGFIYIGSNDEIQEDRPRPDLKDIMRVGF